MLSEVGAAAARFKPWNDSRPTNSRQSAPQGLKSRGLLRLALL